LRGLARLAAVRIGPAGDQACVRAGGDAAAVSGELQRFDPLAGAVGVAGEGAGYAGQAAGGFRLRTGKLYGEGRRRCGAGVR